MLLQEIQSLENKLIYSDNCGSYSTIFTEMMYKTKEYINPQPEDENLINYKAVEKYVVPEYSGYKFYIIKPEQMDAIIDTVAKFIELGSNLNVACTLAGYSYNVLRPKFTIEHKEKFKIARELKYGR
jgi:hypothetical protein